MSARQKSSESNSAAVAALLVMAGFLAAPASATASSAVPCKQATEAMLHVHVDSLSAEVVSHNGPAPAIINESIILDEIDISASRLLLAPRAEAAIKDAFSESDDLNIGAASAETRSEFVTEKDEQQESEIDMNAKLPGVSADELSRFKKQMYRRDI